MRQDCEECQQSTPVEALEDGICSGCLCETAYQQGKKQGRAECVAGPPQWEPPPKRANELWVWGRKGKARPVVHSAAEVRAFWIDGDWCAPLRLPERRES